MRCSHPGSCCAHRAASLVPQSQGTLAQFYTATRKNSHRRFPLTILLNASALALSGSPTAGCVYGSMSAGSLKSLKVTAARQGKGWRWWCSTVVRVASV